MRKHIAALDGVRGIAIFLVLMTHFFGHMRITNPIDRILLGIADRGGLGVDLFFVLSGFLITGILLASKGRDRHFFRNFYMRRTLRIFPLYFGVLATVFLIFPWLPWFQGPELDMMREKQAWAWTYMVNFLSAKEGNWTPLAYISHFWSLAVEEHFYLFWPLAVYFASRKGLIRLSFGLILFSLAFSMGAVIAGWSVVAVRVVTPACLAGLCLGGLAAALVDRLDFRKALIVAAAGVGLKVVVETLEWFGIGSHDLLLPLSTFAWDLLFISLVLGAWFAEPKTWFHSLLTWRPLVFLGKYSYGVYVFHLPIYWALSQRQSIEWFELRVDSYTAAVLLNGVLNLVLSILIAFISYHLFEKRFLRLKVKYE